jgi:hypothetical protein
VFCITATFPLVVCLSSCLINEKHLAFSIIDHLSNGKQPKGSSAEADHELLPMLAATDTAPLDGVAAEGVGNGRSMLHGRVAGLPAGSWGTGSATEATLQQYAHDFRRADTDDAEDDELLLDNAALFPLGHRAGVGAASPDAAGTGTWASSLDRSASTSKLKSSSKAAPVSGKADGANLRAQQAVADSSSSGGGRQRLCLQQVLGGMQESVMLFWNAVKQPHVLRPVMFLFLWQVSGLSYI